MTSVMQDPVLERLQERIGKPLSADGPSAAPDEVNIPMIRHWVDAFEDRNPVYLDAAFAATSRFGGIVAPPSMLQTWTMGRVAITGIAGRGGAAAKIDPDSALAILADAGFTGTLATNSELEFERYLRLGDHLESATVLESISERKRTALGEGYFVTWVSTYTDGQDRVVGRQRFRIFKFAPGSSPRPAAGDQPASRPAPAEPGPTPEVTQLPPFELDVTATVVVAGAIASRDFMPVHHDREYAAAQGAGNIFMNILSSTGYVSRYVTDWAGPQARIRRIAIRLGAPATAGCTLRFTGHVADSTVEGDERVLSIAVTAANEFGDHVTGTVTCGVPLGALITG